MKSTASVAIRPARLQRRRGAAMVATLALLGASLTLAGCGQKGPLTLPQGPAKPAAASAPAR